MLLGCQSISLTNGVQLSAITGSYGNSDPTAYRSIPHQDLVSIGVAEELSAKPKPGKLDESEKENEVFELEKKHDEVTPDGKKVMFMNPILKKTVVVPV